MVLGGVFSMSSLRGTNRKMLLSAGEARSEARRGRPHLGGGAGLRQGLGLLRDLALGDAGGLGHGLSVGLRGRQGRGGGGRLSEADGRGVCEAIGRRGGVQVEGSGGWATRGGGERVQEFMCGAQTRGLAWAIWGAANTQMGMVVLAEAAACGASGEGEAGHACAEARHAQGRQAQALGRHAQLAGGALTLATAEARPPGPACAWAAALAKACGVGAVEDGELPLQLSR